MDLKMVDLMGLDDAYNFRCEIFKHSGLTALYAKVLDLDAAIMVMLQDEGFHSPKNKWDISGSRVEDYHLAVCDVVEAEITIFIP